MEQHADGTGRRSALAAESPELVAARARASEPDDVPSAEVGSFLAWLGRWVGARTAVEVGSAAGVTGLWLLEGLTERGVLTSVEPDAHRHGLAAQAFAEAGVGTRVRAIEGDTATVLPRLADTSYDLVLLQTAGDPAHLQHALRLVRPGGVVVVRGVSDRPRVRSVVAGLVGSDDEDTLGLLEDRTDLDVTVVPVERGLLLARVLA